MCMLIVSLMTETAFAEPGSDNTPMDSNVNYGQIFMEEERQAKSFPFEISVFGGGEFINPYTNSLFLGAELKHKINSLLQLGWEFFWIFPKFSYDFSSFKEMMDTYGISSQYSIIQKAFYMNWHYNIVHGHVNVLGLYRVNMRFPVHFGFGFIDILKKGLLPAVKFGIGPLIQWTPRLGMQFLMAQSISLGSTSFAYPQFYLAFICRF